jgi:hypothetical protein
MTHISEILPPLTDLIEAAELFAGYQPETQWAAMRLFASSKKLDLGMLAHLLTTYQEALIHE